MNSKLIGSSLIIAGTAIGGGMLAMPIISSGVGFTGITIVMILIWLTMCYTAILLVETYKDNNPEDGLSTMTYKYLGKAGSIVTGISMLTLMYALVSAYIAGGSDILRLNLSNWLETDISPQVTAFIFTILFGGIVGLGARVVDIATRWIFIIKLIFLLIVIIVMFGYVRIDNLLQMPIESKLFFSSIPVIFTSFGFHIVVPSMVKYLDGDIKLLKKAFIYGSLLPLIVYIIWQLSILGSIDSNTFFTIIKETQGLEAVILAVNGVSESKWMNIPLNIFFAAAILTSFLGVALALFDYVKDLSKKKAFGKNSIIIYLITFIPPLLFALYYPKGFVIALSYAAISVVITSLFIPVLMYIKVKKERQETISFLQKIAFSLIFAFGTSILVIQVLMTAGVLPILD
ncbi:aromatic amino acid transporter [Myroides odoratimimus CCUG 12901]|uniref:aromatic amino acid transport family protein n=1 Tax=Myroides odoratimimus TaxID=76832 RepID=UPI000245F924|nr:aromatic amino acid transport family protein [Myroides odoratimimus]EHO06490.1 aromatic amino acid transporter [Myroides odoratimimus CCUG 12901]MCS7472139.1 amino acid permease [Myroides odoratimimus]MDM1096794.1 tyrosine transporter TyrP [Myroides odoratimimus]MDM1400609.1 tyrosine transporter TyrP [Myroides odoratimimus]MDM1410948.1 tyrosine transporter TyrP [Myroides odoratimimus]